MQSQYCVKRLSEFRADTAGSVDWVRSMGGRIWLTRHGRGVAAVVPMFQCEMLETWEGATFNEERARMERDYARWKAIKTIEARTKRG